MERIAHKVHKPVLQITDQALAKLQSHDWPGNVRELENLLTQALVQARTSVLTPDLLPFRESTTPAPSAQLPETGTPPALRTLDQLEAEHIQLVLNHTGGHKGKSCDILGISRPALDRKIKKYELTLP